jgi:hypothetical protein
MEMIEEMKAWPKKKDEGLLRSDRGLSQKDRCQEPMEAKIMNDLEYVKSWI